MQLTVWVDDGAELYVDGEFFAVHDVGAYTINTYTYAVSDDVRLVALRAINNGGFAGIKMYLENGRYTNEHVRCTGYNLDSITIPKTICFTKKK